MKQGIQQGMQQGRCLEVYSLVQDGILDPEVGASRVSMSLDDSQTQCKSRLQTS